MGKAITVLTLAFVLLPLAVRADDAGPPRIVGQIRAEARRLLARQARAAGVDPKDVAISDVVVSANQALLSWKFAKNRGLMGLLRQDDRWWDALDATLDGNCWQIQTTYPLLHGAPPYPADYAQPDYEPPPGSQILTGNGLSRELAATASIHNADVRTSDELFEKSRAGNLVRPSGCFAATYMRKADAAVYGKGATIAPPRFETSGYGLTLAYSANDAAAGAHFTMIYVRPPTSAEFLPNHPLAPGWGYSNALCFFDIAIGSAKPVTFKPGTVLDVWFPFVLDDQLQYSVSLITGGTPSGLVKGSIFDNTVHFVLPEFTIAPDQPLMAEIDGDAKASQ